MKVKDKKEIVQLWWVAERYFNWAKESKVKLKDKDLETTVKKLAAKCNNMSDITGVNALLMELNAHLGSCAVRLSTIDEKRKGCSPKRWGVYKNLIEKGKKGNLMDDDIKENVKGIVHFLLRHNVAHDEDIAKEKGKTYEQMQKVFRGLKSRELFENMKLVMEEMKPEIEPIIATRRARQ